MGHSKKIVVLFILLLAAFAAKQVAAQDGRHFIEKIGQVRQKLNFARDIQTTANNPEAGKLIRMADTNLRRAASAARNRRRLVAMRQLRKADQATNSALKILFRENIANRRRRLESLIKKAETLIQTNESREARQLFDEGLKNRDMAVKSLKKNNFKDALFHYNKAVFLLKKSITATHNEDKSAAQLSEDEAYRFKQFYKRNYETLAESSNANVRKNTDLALKVAEKADRARQAGKFQDAIDYYHQATRLMSRALNIATGKGSLPETRADEEVALLDELIDSLENQLTPETSDKMTDFLFSQIKLLQENAHVFLKEQKLNEAIKNTAMARNLAERLLKKMKKPDREKKPSIEQALNDLEMHIQQIESQVTQDTDTEAKILLNYAKTWWRKAQTAAKDNNFLLAFEVINMAENLLTSADQIMRDNEPQIFQQKLKERIDSLSKIIAENRPKAERAKNSRIEFHFNQAESMQQLAQENYDKGFFHVANAFLRLGMNHIRKIGRVN